MSVVRGKNAVLRLAQGVMACGRTCAFTTTTSLIETTTAGTGKGATFRPQKNVTTGSIEGVVFLGDAGKITLPYLRKYQLEHTLCDGVFERQAETGEDYTDEFEFYITSISDTGAAGDFNTFQLEIQVTGNPVGKIGQTVFLLDNVTGLPLLDNDGNNVLTQQITTLY